MGGWQVWLWLRLDAVHKVADVFTGVFGMFCLFALIAVAFCKYEVENPKLVKTAKRVALSCLCCMCLCLFVFVAVPTTKQAAAIYMIPKITKSEFVAEELPEDAKQIYRIFKTWIKEHVKEEEDDG